MAKMKIYLVRHGETDLNAKDIYQSPQTLLSKTGLKQSSFLANRFKKIKIDKIFSSPFERTKQTAQMIKKVTGKEIEYVNDLRELTKPSQFVGKSYTDSETERIKKEIASHMDDPLWHYSDEENFFDLVNRAKKIIKMLDDLEYADILLVTHEGFMKVLISTLIFEDIITPELFDKIYYFLRIKNTGITVLDLKNGDFKLITWNDHTHLG